jgi:enoyl-CoA hydratase
MAFSHIQFEAQEGIALITIDRPQKRNALSLETLDELGHAFEEVGDDETLKALIITGQGDKAFAAGADIKELASLDGMASLELSHFGQRQFRMLETIRKPSGAAINGNAFGGGLELAMACTVRFSVPEALLGQPEVKLGTTPGYGGTQRLPQLIGRGRALEMLISAEPVTAMEALTAGLVNRIVPPAELLTFSHAWLHKCLQHGTQAIGLTMEAVDVGFAQGSEAVFRYESAAFGLIASTQDRAEGIRAFLEKRDPVFTGS